MPVTLETISDLCASFLQPFQPLLQDELVTDICRNGNGAVFVEDRHGKRHVPDCRISEDTLEIACQTVARLVTGAEFSRNHPLLEARLPDGSRISAILKPISLPGTQLTIRKFSMGRFPLTQLVEIGSVSSEAAMLLIKAMEKRESILISGIPGSGKSTLMNALLEMIDPLERLGIIESPAEVQISLPNVTRLEERKEQHGVTPITMRDLVRVCLRQNCDRIIVGEVRGPEAFDLLTAMSTGHEGSISTIHANSAYEALDRLLTYASMAGIGVPDTVLRRLIAGSLKHVVQMVKAPGGRRLSEMITIEGLEDGRFKTKQVYRRKTNNGTH